MSEDSTVLVTGAGVDKTQGIDFPLASDLLPEINGYLTQTDEGKAVEALLRERIPNLRFRFDRFINSAITDIAQREPEQLRDTVTRVNAAVEALPDDEENHTTRVQGQLIVRLFNQLQQIASANQIDEETRNLIDEAFGSQANEFDLDDHIVDIRTLSVSDTFKGILRHVLRQSLESGANEVARALGADLLDIERLLIDKFLGFYNNKLPDIKSYVYIAWAFWAFLVNKDKSVSSAHEDLPFYSNIPSTWKGVTLNYTSFLERKLGLEQVSYFHGGLTQYVRMDNRELLQFDDFEDSSPVEMLSNQVCDNWHFDEDNPVRSRCLIPSLVPPLRLKPILSKEYVTIWYNALKWLENANKIIIAGYSLNTADEHFNDLFRGLTGKQIIVIGPTVLSDEYMERISSVFGIAPNQFTTTRIQGNSAKQNQHIKLIEAYADGVNLSEL